MAQTTTTTLNADLQTYFSKRLLDIASKDTVLTESAYKESIPAGSSKTISFTQYSRLAIPGSVLTEGTTPTDTALNPSAITATIDQWGAYITLTDLAELTVKHPVVNQALMLLGEQAAETVETTVNTVLVAGTAVRYADGVANRAAIGNANVVDANEFRTIAKTLRINGARPFEDGYFHMFVDPSVEMDILADAEMRAVTQFKPEAAQEGRVIGAWYGIKVFRSNIIPTIASTVTVHTSYVVGRNAYAVTDLQKLDTYVEGPGGNADPLHQRRTLGWKTGFKSVILNNNFMVRLESGSAY